jgi:SARP family transcriptional regulator, regulator of embCAB operon
LEDRQHQPPPRVGPRSVRGAGDISELSLLGGFVLSVGGDALLGISDDSQRLLAFLALQDGVVTRERAAGALWPESSEEGGRASLRSVLSRLDAPVRQVLRATAIDLGVDEGVAIDVHRSKALARALLDPDTVAAEADLDADAVASLSKDVLPGWYEDWALIAAEDWRQLRLQALEAVAARLTAAHRLDEAAAAALIAVEAEPLRESARATLIRVHVVGGHHSTALGEFERYRVLLHAELGIEPTSRLTQLVGGLRAR